LIPECLDDLIGRYDEERLIDLMVDSLVINFWKPINFSNFELKAFI